MAIEPVSSGLNLTSFISPVISAAASAGIAWFTAQRVASKNVKKQAFIDLLSKIDELEEAGETLLLCAGNASEASGLFRTVTRLDGRLGRRLTELFLAHKSKSRLAGRDPVPPRITAALIDVRAVACADELASPNRQPCAGNDPKFQVLRERIERLRTEIRSEAEDMNAGDLQS